jgi:hypothetical protein
MPSNPSRWIANPICRTSRTTTRNHHSLRPPAVDHSVIGCRSETRRMGGVPFRRRGEYRSHLSLAMDRGLRGGRRCRERFLRGCGVMSGMIRWRWRGRGVSLFCTLLSQMTQKTRGEGNLFRMPGPSQGNQHRAHGDLRSSMTRPQESPQHHASKLHPQYHTTSTQH